MYTFAETEYKWCPQCAGNIRLEATHCRFCHKPIENRLMKKVSLHPFVTVRSINEWIPDFEKVKSRLPEQFRSRIDQAKSETPKMQVGESLEEQRRQPGGEFICLHEPPEAKIHAILMDLLLSLYANGESIAEVCDLPQMKLLEITPQEVLAEFELRKEEMEKGHRCRYCQEFIFANNEECRFCEGSDESAPKPVERSWDKPLDPLLLKDVILYEAAWRIINEEEALPQEMLSANFLSQSDVDQEILRQRSGSSELPMARFTKRMVDLGLVSYWTPEQIALMDIADSGGALDSKKENRAEEALVCYEHALRRTEGKDELMSQRSTILTKLSTYYLQKKDDSKHRLYSDMAHECSKFGMTDEMKAMMDKSHESMKDMFNGGNIFEADPEKRLASLDTDFGLNFAEMDAMISQIEETIPGLGELFSSLQSGMEATMANTRLMLEAQVAEKNGDLAGAEAKYKQALENVDEDRLTGMHSKISILNALGEIKHKQTDDAAAESYLKEALTFASEYAEADPTLGKSSLHPTLTTYASFLRDVGRHEESEQKFLAAMKAEDEVTSVFLKEYGGSAGDYAAQKAEIKEKYSQLLRAMKRDDEAAKLDAEVLMLKKEADERQAELQARRAGT